MAEAFDARPDIEITKFSEDVLGMNRDYVSRLVKTGTANPSPAVLSKICDALGVDPGFILSGHSPRSRRWALVERIAEADEGTLDRIERAIDLFDD